MIRQICLKAIVLLAAAILQSPAEAQQLYIGPGGVQYNGYGQGYYGGYGQGSPYYEPNVRVYSGYGNGPYGYGSGRRQFPSAGSGSAYQFPTNGYSNGFNNNGYSNNGYYGPNYSPAYSPYGFSMTTF